MKKDVIIAVVIGFVIGGTAALAITNIPILFKTAEKSRSEKIAATISPSQESKNVQNGEAQLIIEKPENGKIMEEKVVTVAGKSKPGNTVIIDTDLESQSATAADDGSFSGKITLGEGVNTLYVTSYDVTGEASEKTITVFYTAEKL